jgi:cytochrome c oxidase cbb3-type subunit 3
MKPLCLAALTLLIGIAGCDQAEHREATATDKAATNESQHGPIVALVDIAPGGVPPIRQHSKEAAKFDGNPEEIAAGRQLFVAYNCVGCHFNGGGGMGPALMDDKWIYGSSMENIGATIREGRPNGMPSFRAMVVEDQVWQLAAYIRSLSNLAERSKQASSEPRNEGQQGTQ